MKITKFFALLCAASVAFVACEPISQNGPTPEPTGSITLSANKTAVQLGDTVTFTVTDSEGQDVTVSAIIYDPDLNPVSNAKFTATTTGTLSFFATIGSETSNYLTITVMASMPEIPADPQPSNLAFNHRAVFIDHTGINCGYCPSVIDLFRAMAETEWHDHYNEVQSHAGGYANGDPANSTAANTLNSFHSPQGYPDVRMNFYGGKVANRTVNYMSQMLQSYILVDGADVGISMAVEGSPTSVMVASQIKAARSKEYHVNAWLLESNIYSPNQSGATQSYHKIYNYALRNFSEATSRGDVSGVSIGVVEAGKTYEYATTIPITSTKWNWENMGVLIVVSAKDANGRWDIVNSLYCNVGETKAFEYIN